MFEYILCLLLVPLVLSEIDLCRNPKLDSITYVPKKSMWFFTSGGHYWYIKDEDFPPGPPTAKLPDGFTRGDAVFYIDWMTVCTDSSVRHNDQLIVLVEKGSDGNNIIEFDTRQASWSKSRVWESDGMVGPSKIEDPKAEIDAIFSIRDSEVYVVQKKKYAAVELKALCQDPNAMSKQFGSQSVDALENSLDTPFDAITVKDNNMFYFIGSKYWRSKVETFKSRDGKIVISKGRQQNVSSNFFKFKDCPQNEEKQPTEESAPKTTTHEIKAEEEGAEVPDNGGAPPPPTSKQTDGGSGSSLLPIIFIVVVLLVVGLVVAIIGVIVIRNKSDADKGSKKGRPFTSKKSQPGFTSSSGQPLKLM